MKRFILSSIGLAAFFAFIGTSSAHAAVTGFQAGRIIDDQIFTNASSMNVAEIQNFLNSKVPECDTSGTKPASEYGRPDLTHAQYATTRGWAAPPYTCLRDYSEGGLSSAQLIYNLSQQYQINPQVLIVTLQKESSLVTDTWPLSSQYRTATGYGCPDSGPNNSANCNSTYYGFTNQLTWTAKMFRSVLNQSPTWYSPYVAGANNYIQWNPNAGCGGTNVYIQNWSTAALYDYTPYQPNQAALNADWGSSSDGCSAYGNRNFYLYFTSWFGATRVSDYQWQPVSQEYYTDATKTTRAGSDIPPGGKIHLVVKAKNTGVATWSNSTNPVNLASLPSGRSSIFCGPSWLSCDRAARLTESSVAPGSIGTFEFDAYNPGNTSGVYREYFSLVSEGMAWFNNPAMNFFLTPQPTIYTWNIAGQQAFTDSSMVAPKDMWSIRPGESAYFVVKAKNTGNVTWTNNGANPVHLATSRGSDRMSQVCTPSNWLSCNRPANMQEASVAPGGTGTFAFTVTMPNNPGSYIEHFNLVAEGKSWFNDTSLNYYIKVQPNIYSWNVAGQQAFTDSSMTVSKDMWSIRTGESAYLVVKAKNTGNVTWTKSGANPIHLATSRPYDRSSAMYNAGWLSANRPAAMTEDSVAPGQTGTFAFPVTMPSKAGSYIEYLNLVSEGKAWFNDTGINYYIKVQN